MGYVHVRSVDFPDFPSTGKVRKCLKVEDGEGQLYVEIAASDGARKILERLAQEKAEEDALIALEKEKEERNAHIRELCRERLEQLRNLVPQYDRKVTFDPFVLLAVVGFVLFVLTMLIWLWQLSGPALDMFVSNVIDPSVWVYHHTRDAIGWIVSKVRS